MELLLISENAVKIMLSREDAVYYNIDCRHMDYSDQKTRDSIQRIMDEVKIKTGFDASMRQVLFEVYIGKEGGLEMFVTKVGSKGDSDKARLGISEDKEESVYFIESLEHAVAAAVQLYKRGYAEKSDIYLSENEKGFYFIIWEKYIESSSVRNRIGEYPFMSEYGVRREGLLSISYIKEYAKCLCRGDAVSVLANAL